MLVCAFAYILHSKFPPVIAIIRLLLNIAMETMHKSVLLHTQVTPVQNAILTNNITTSVALGLTTEWNPYLYHFYSMYSSMLVCIVLL